MSATANEYQLPPAPPQYSPDGTWFWNGAKWVPAGGAVGDASATFADATGPDPKTRRESEPERTIAEARRHNSFYFAWASIAGAFGLLSLVAGLVAGGVQPAGVILTVLGGGLCWLGLINRRETRIYVTNRRVAFSVGVLRKRSFELMLSKVESLSIRRDLFGRMLGYGSVVIGGTGGSKEVLTGLVNPDAFRAAVQEAAHQAQLRS
jgi:hypothetical protein